MTKASSNEVTVVSSLEGKVDTLSMALAAFLEAQSKMVNRSRGSRKAAVSEPVTETDRVFAACAMQRGSNRGRVLAELLARGPGDYFGTDVAEKLSLSVADILAAARHVAFVLEKFPAASYSLAVFGKGAEGVLRFSSDAIAS